MGRVLSLMRLSSWARVPFLGALSLMTGGCEDKAKAPKPELAEASSAKVESTTPQDGVVSQVPSTDEPASEPPNVETVALDDGDSVWAGTIGKAKVVVTLRVRGGQVGGRYFYEKHGRSLILSGTDEGGTLELTEQGGAPEKVFGEVLGKLSLKSDGRRLSGTWKAKSADKSVPVLLARDLKQSYDELRPVQRLGEKQALGGLFKYESMKSIDEHLVYCKTNEKQPVDVTLIPGLLVLEEDCHFAFEGKMGARIIIEGEGVQVTSAREGLDKDEVNRKIAYTMGLEAGETWAGSHSTKVIYAGGALLTLEIATSGLGLGAYPDHDQYGKTIDLRTGKFLEWSDLVERSSYPRLRQAFLDQATKDAEEYCHYSEVWEEGEEPFQLIPFVTDKGLHVTPGFPHVSKTCQYDAFGMLLDRALTQEIAKKGSVLLEKLPKP